MKAKNQIFLILAVMLLTALACGLGQNATEEVPDGNVLPTLGTESISEDQTSEDDEVLFLDISGITSIELLTPSEDVGLKPLFEWSPVESAERYSLFLQFPDGEPYWAWSGAANMIYLGGLDSPPAEDLAGPVLLPGMHWAVIAFDSGGNIIASSPLQTISP